MGVCFVEGSNTFLCTIVAEGVCMCLFCCGLATVLHYFDMIISAWFYIDCKKLCKQGVSC